jgi:hypothetical protein
MWHEGPPSFLGQSRFTITAYEVNLEVEKTYYVRGVMKDGQCRSWISAQEDGTSELGKQIVFDPTLSK